MICLIQHFGADFLWKVSLKILNFGIILETSNHALIEMSDFILENVCFISIFKSDKLICLVLCQLAATFVVC